MRAGDICWRFASVWPPASLSSGVRPLDAMTVSRRTKAVVSGLCVGAFFAAFWFVPMFSDSRPEPMLMPGQSRSTVIASEVWTGFLIFVGAGVPAALIVYYRPGKREDRNDVA